MKNTRGNLWARLAPATCAAIVLGMTMPAFAADGFNGGKYLVYVGTYTGPKSQGIYALRFDASQGTIEQAGLAGEVVNPSFVALDRTHKFLYAVSELGNSGTTNAFVSSFAIDSATGKLKFINKVSSGGGGACHLVVDKTNKMLIVANYGSGSVAAFQVKKDGSLSEMTSIDRHSGSSVNARRQRGPHAHAVVLSEDNRFVFVPDLGLDEVMSYKIDPATATLTANDPPYVKVKPGLGPRHFVFDAASRFAYLVDEMGSSVTAFRYDKKKGALTDLETVSTLPEDFKGVNNSAEIQIDKANRFLYASNRGHNSITQFAIDRKKGTLTKVQVTPTEGKTPRNFVIDPTGRFLLAANQDSDNIVVFRIDPQTGKLTATGATVSAPSPVCLQFVPVK